MLKIRNNLYNDWVESYENLTIKNRKDINTRNKNIKALLLSFYSLCPPLKNEGLNLKIADSHEKAKKLEYTIHTSIGHGPYIQIHGILLNGSRNEETNESEMGGHMVLSHHHHTAIKKLCTYQSPW